MKNVYHSAVLFFGKESSTDRIEGSSQISVEVSDNLRYVPRRNEPSSFSKISRKTRHLGENSGRYNCPSVKPSGKPYARTALEKRYPLAEILATRLYPVDLYVRSRSRSLGRSR